MSLMLHQNFAALAATAWMRLKHCRISLIRFLNSSKNLTSLRNTDFRAGSARAATKQVMGIYLKGFLLGILGPA